MNIKIFFSLSQKIFQGKWHTLILIILLFGSMTSMMQLVNPLVLYRIMDALEAGKPAALFQVCAIAALCIGAYAVLIYFTNTYCHPWVFGLANNGKEKIFQRLYALPYDQVATRYEDGDIVFRIDNGCNECIMIWSELTAIVAVIIAIISLLTLSLSITPWFSVAVFVLVAIDFARTGLQNKKNAVFAQNLQVVEGKQEKCLHTLVHQMEFLSMSATVHIPLSQYRNQRDESWAIRRNQMWLNTWLDAVNEIVATGLKGIVILLIVPQSILGLVGAGLISTSFSVFDTLRSNLNALRQMTIRLPERIAPIMRLDELLATRRNEFPTKAAPSDDGIIVTNAHLAFNDRPILDGLSLTIRAGEKVAIVGRNGSGKSTLMKLILGLNGTGEGGCLIQNQDVATLTPTQYRSLVTYAPSRSQLFIQSIGENVEMGADEDESNNVKIALQAVNGIAPSGDYLEKMANELSGGQAQCVNIARALIHGAPVLLADEPAASLDNEKGNRVLQALLHSHETVIVITHHPHHLRFFDRIFVIEKGQVAVAGTLDAICAHPAFLRWKQSDQELLSEGTIQMPA